MDMSFQELLRRLEEQQGMISEAITWVNSLLGHAPGAPTNGHLREPQTIEKLKRHVAKRKAMHKRTATAGKRAVHLCDEPIDANGAFLEIDARDWRDDAGTLSSRDDRKFDVDTDRIRRHHRQRRIFAED